MKRPEQQFWIYVSLLAGVFLLLLGGPLISCAKAKRPYNPQGQLHPTPLSSPPSIAPWNQQEPAVTAKLPITLRAQLDRAAVLKGSDGLVRVRVELEAQPHTSQTENVASDIVVVVDTSGSMDGEKLSFARQAILALIEKLRPEDRLALVEYSARAHVLAPLIHATSANQGHLRNLAYNLRTTGSTNMSEGLDRASELLQQSLSLGRTGRLLLLSDGLANAGDSSESGLRRRAEKLSQQGFALSTMGIGEDFDERMMASLATSGTGAFYYLSQLSYLSEFFEAELDSARATYAQNATLRFVAAPGVRLESAMGLPLKRRGDKIEINLGNLYSDRSRTVWLALKVPTYRLGDAALGRLSLSYRHEGDESVISVGSLPKVACLDDEHLYHKNIHRSLWEQALLEDVFTKTEEDFGDAIRSGSRQELDRAMKRAQTERELAVTLGRPMVVKEIEQLEEKAENAAIAQKAPASVRNKSAKKTKARGYQKRNKGNYSSADRAMQAY